ncbi:hypothetical protein QQS21_001897, partial [Conoideocrella luteorostrata]
PATNAIPAHYNQHAHGRSQFNAQSGSSSTPTNMYNPPRPPEVYTLPDNINDALHQQIRQRFQHDSGDRVLFFSAPPLDRPCKQFSPQTAGVGHSARYLAGREGWLADREKKRKKRDDLQHGISERSKASTQHAGGTVDIVASAATDAMNKWFQKFDDPAVEWQQTAGLVGWSRCTGKE